MSTKIDKLLNKAHNLDYLSLSDGKFLFENANLAELMFCADSIRKKIHPNNIATYIVDRNINHSNICQSNCLFCNFCRSHNSKDSYILNIDDYKIKIDELYRLGGKQILIQGGIHQIFGLKYYTDLFDNLKSLFPDLKLHALGPAEIISISKIENISCKEVLKQLIESGLDSLPGAGAEILSDRVRNILSPLKCTSDEWLNVMQTAHELNITTSATMMFGHIETIDERFEHIVKIRNLQDEKPINTKGFVSFTLWPFASKSTRLLKRNPNIENIDKHEFIKMVSLSRIMLPNIPNIQASWLTMGADTAQICLHAGANDLSSIMIEENVVSAAGKNHKMGIIEIENCINNAGLIPKQRNQEYQIVN